MQIKIMSRERIEMVSHFPFPPGTALISITDADDFPVKLKNRPQHLLRLSFDDVDLSDLLKDVNPDCVDKTTEERFHLFTREQAKKLACFFHTIRNSAQTIICQCEFGQSRSAAVAAAILEFIEHRGIDIFADYRYFPNKRVFKLTLEALKSSEPVSSTHENQEDIHDCSN